ncbi:unnamed protein product [Vitrella brassicaformis CCMP3155]|uniref:Nucleotide-diphospho-sugar transferase domain-containing protein n=1 Tax=Vitrella brassicaformis (strain CCMP3155) TaxID=1169540 RepID=A0A0G4GFG5_VITBC|nr:unnamed protein product [Vitrella brassicaformis CCMP3155]|eukprot:CEM28239.1 unnamed protein product [Vitrella brassicaformis CCMP3155]
MSSSEKAPQIFAVLSVLSISLWSAASYDSLRDLRALRPAMLPNGSSAHDEVPSDASSDFLSRALLSSIADSRGLIILTTVNCGMVDFAVNWARSIQRQGIKSFLIICYDDKCMEILTQVFPHNVARAPPEKQISSAATKWLDKNFISLCKERPYFFREILLRGFSVLFNDVDMVWRKNVVNHLGNGKRIVLQLDNPHAHHFCGCFQYFPVAPESFMLIQEWERQMQREEMQRKDYGDQEGLNRAVKEMQRNFTVHVLPQKLFPSGRGFFGVARPHPSERLTPEERQQVVAVHANWIIGRERKKAQLEKYGLWLLSAEEDSFSPKFCVK